jgi:hypothetical protein
LDWWLKGAWYCSDYDYGEIGVKPIAGRNADEMEIIEVRIAVTDAIRYRTVMRR